MTTTFPSTEPPPHPESGESINSTEPAVNEQPVQVDANLAAAMDFQQEPETSPTPAVSTQPSVTDIESPIPNQNQIDSLSKKGPPKTLLIVMVVFVILLVTSAIMYFVRRPKDVTLVGTKGELTWWGIENSESVVKPLIEEYEAKNPNVKITYKKQSESEYRERLTSSLAQGRGPDIFEIHNSWVPMYKTELSTLPESIMSKDDYKKSFYPIATQDFSSGGEFVAIPLEYDALTLFYNQDIFDSAATPVPETWDDVTVVAQNLTQRGAEKKIILQSGVALGNITNVDYWQDIVALMIIQNVSDPLKPNIKSFDAISFYLSFSDVWNTSLPNSTSAFAKNKVGMFFAPTRTASDVVAENPNLRFKTAKLPQLAKVKATDPDYAYATYWAQSVWKRSRNSEVAWDFLKFLSSPESLQKMNQIRKNSNSLEKAYPRPEMAILQSDDKVLGSLIPLASKAKSSLLHGNTFDGETGINSQIGKAYSNGIAEYIEKNDAEKVLPTLTTNLNSIVSKYLSKK